MLETKSEIGKFIDPEAIISQLDIRLGSFVADFGCGPGYFSLPFAQIIGDDGRIYSLDVLPQALEAVEGKAKTLGLSNVITKRVNLEREKGSGLDNETLDWVVMKDVLFQNQKRQTIISEAYRILKKGGRVLLVEWNQQDLNIGPEMDIRIPSMDLQNMFIEAGFSIEKNIDAGNFHYSFVAIK